MTDTKKRYGYTGQGLRINLTTGKVSVEPTFPRFDGLIGGTAFGYKVMWDEVPPETSCYDPANKLVIAPGPLSGTGPSARAAPQSQPSGPPRGLSRSLPPLTWAANSRTSSSTPAGTS